MGTNPINDKLNKQVVQNTGDQPLSGPSHIIAGAWDLDAYTDAMCEQVAQLWQWDCATSRRLF